jgi:XTP/dITP diphosphohydrolase
MPIGVTVVTSNPSKLREIRTILEGERQWSVRWSRRTLPEPQADSLEVVVRAKLDALAATRHWQIVEDSGLFIDGLNGFPGVYSAYALRTVGLPPLVSWLAGRRRTAVFRTVAGARRGTVRRTAVGEVRGRIAARPRGTSGFGFDPIFIPEGERRTYAEMSPSEKAATSHRARAIRALADRIERAEGRH